MVLLLYSCAATVGFGINADARRGNMHSVPLHTTKPFQTAQEFEDRFFTARPPNKRRTTTARAASQGPPDVQHQPSHHTFQQFSRRQALSASAALAIGANFSHVQPVFGLPESAAGAADGLPLVPHTPLAPGLDISKVIKGCWQLSGGHKGEKQTDRTGGEAAVKVGRAAVPVSNSSSTSWLKPCASRK